MKYTIEELSIWKEKIMNVERRLPAMYYTQSTRFAMPHLLRTEARYRIKYDRN